MLSKTFWLVVIWVRWECSGLFAGILHLMPYISYFLKVTCKLKWLSLMSALASYRTCVTHQTGLSADTVMITKLGMVFQLSFGYQLFGICRTHYPRSALLHLLSFPQRVSPTITLSTHHRNVLYFIYPFYKVKLKILNLWAQAQFNRTWLHFVHHKLSDI